MVIKRNFITNPQKDIEWIFNIYKDKGSRFRMTSKQEGNKITINFFIKKLKSIKNKNDI